MDLTVSAWIAMAIFLIVYGFIVSDKFPKAILVILGAFFLFLFKIYLPVGGESQLIESLNFVDFNVISLIIGMMIIVQVTSSSGVFTHVAMKIILFTRGNLRYAFFLLMIMTAFITAFVSNVTAVMVMTPIFLAICLRFHVNALPFLMTEILMSNIGGTATPLGDMTNIIIASKAGFSFGKVVSVLGPVVVVIVLVIGGLATWYFSRKLIPKKDILLEDLASENFIHDPVLMIKGLSILVLVVLGLIFKDWFALDNGAIALSGAMILLLITKISPDEAFKKYVHWSIIFFFVGLFILIGALEETGVVERLAELIVNVTGSNTNLLAMVLLWSSALFSAFIDNIPFATTMIPIIKNIGVMTGNSTDPLFWALALGACIGGSGTIIGASCNLVVVGLAEQNGIKITFMQYMKYAFGMMLIAIGISSVYLYLFIL